MLKPGLILALSATCAFAQVAEPDAYLCAGTEPFWGLTIEGNTAALQRDDDDPSTFNIPHKAVAQGRYWPIVYSLIADFDTALAIVRPDTCNDGMSDTSYAFTIDVLTQDRGEAIVLSGCCRLPDTGN